MRTCHILENQPLAWYLDKEHEVAQDVQEETFFTWIAPPTVIYGHHQVQEQEMDIDFCNSHGIAMVQRQSGGGCVYADRGNVMLSYITPSTHSEAVFAAFIERVAAALRAMGYPAVSTQHNDILVNGHKVSGSACQALKNATIVHSTMLYDVDFDVLQKAITPTQEKLEKHAVQSVRQRVMNLKTIQDMGSTEQFRQALQQHIMKTYLFSSESVSEGHPDKVADQISDAVLDNFLAQDPDCHVACETLVTTGQVIVAGEVKAKCYVDIPSVVRQTIKRIGYNKAEYMFEANSCGILQALHEQSADIDMGVSKQHKLEQGAGDQGMMFGYATTETESYMPLTLDMAHTLVYTLAHIRKEGKQMTYLRPDTKSQVTIEYNDHNEPIRLDTIVLSTQHDPDVPQSQIEADIRHILLPEVAKRDKRYGELLQGDFKLLVNPTGQFVIGGPHGDTGLTGRKIIVDTYGGRGAHGGGAFSGKDPSKVDRSAAYMARYIAKNMVAAGVAKEMLVQISYAIGVAKPVSLCVNTYGTGIVPDDMIADKVNALFDLRPYAIEQTLKLRQPMYEQTASYGHFGRKNEVVTKTFMDENGQPITREVELFTWEKLDRVEDIKRAFGL